MKTQERIAEVLAEESAEPLQWFWLSFVDTQGKHDRFLGVAIVEARGIVGASQRAHVLGINPGGQLVALPIPDLPEKFVAYTDRLLSRADLQEAGFEPVSLRELEEREDAQP